MDSIRQPYWCGYCQHPREDCGGTDGTCPRVEAAAVTYREEKDAGRYRVPLVNLRRLQNERETGMSQGEMARETVALAKAEGREIESVKGYGDVKPPQRKTPDMRNVFNG